MTWVHNKNANQHAHSAFGSGPFLFAQTPVITLTDNGFIIESSHERPCLEGSDTNRAVKPHKVARGLTSKK